MIDAPVDVPRDSGESGDADGATTLTDARMDTAIDRTKDGGSDFCAGHILDGGPIPDVTSEVFCAKYGSICQFGGAGGYANMADCLSQYNGVVPAIQGCRASGLCDAALVYLAPGVTIQFLQAYCTRALTFTACN